MCKRKRRFPVYKPPESVLLHPTPADEASGSGCFCIYWRVASDPSSTKTAEAANVQLDNEAIEWRAELTPVAFIRCNHKTSGQLSGGLLR